MNINLCFLILFLKINNFSKALSDVEKPKHPPYLVVIMEEQGNFRCIGTLISFSQVLTTGSCVQNTLNGIQILPLNYLSFLNPEEVTRTVSKIISQHEKNKIKPMERLVVLEVENPYSENDALKPVALPKDPVLRDVATEYRLVTVTLEEKVNPRYDLLHQEEQYFKHLQSSPERKVTFMARSGKTSTAAPPDSELQKTLVIEDAHPLLTLRISSVLTKTSKECDSLVKEYFDLKENNHKIICSAYSSSPGVCKKDYGAPLVDGDTLVGIMTYSKLECGDPGMYQAVHKDNQFLKCARTCQKELCAECKNVISVSDVPKSVQVVEREAPNQLRSGGDALQDCPDERNLASATLTSKSTSSSAFKTTYYRNEATNSQLLLIVMTSTMLCFLSN